MTFFDILTPVFESGLVLETCIRSVSDQGSGVRHLIQDGASRDEATKKILSRHAANVVSEADAGMYDALNRALDRSEGDVVGHLNADEQYLPGVLSRVRKIFDSMSDIDVVCGDILLADIDWNPLSYRQSVLPSPDSAGLIPLPVPTCGMFIRKSLFEKGLRYRADLRAIADAVLVQDIIRMKARWYFDRVPYAVFSLHDNNLSNSGVAESDVKKIGRNGRGVMSILKRGRVWLKRLRTGAYRRRDVEVMVYTAQSNDVRERKQARQIGWKWPSAR